MLRKILILIMFLILTVTYLYAIQKAYTKEEAISNLKKSIQNKKNPISIFQFRLRKIYSDNISLITKDHFNDIEEAFYKPEILFEDKNGFNALITYGKPPSVISFYYVFIKRNNIYYLDDIQFAD